MYPRYLSKDSNMNPSLIRTKAKSGQRRTPLLRLHGSHLAARFFIATRAPRWDEPGLVALDINTSIRLPLGLFPGRSSPMESRDRQSVVGLDACTFRSSTVSCARGPGRPHIDLRIQPWSARRAGQVSSVDETSRGRPRVSRLAHPI